LFHFRDLSRQGPNEVPVLTFRHLRPDQDWPAIAFTSKTEIKPAESAILSEAEVPNRKRCRSLPPKANQKCTESMSGHSPSSTVSESWSNVLEEEKSADSAILSELECTPDATAFQTQKTPPGAKRVDSAKSSLHWLCDGGGNADDGKPPRGKGGSDGIQILCEWNCCRRGENDGESADKRCGKIHPLLRYGGVREFDSRISRGSLRRYTRYRSKGLSNRYLRPHCDRQSYDRKHEQTWWKEFAWDVVAGRVIWGRAWGCSDMIRYSITIQIFYRNLITYNLFSVKIIARYYARNKLQKISLGDLRVTSNFRQCWMSLSLLRSKLSFEMIFWKLYVLSKDRIVNRGLTQDVEESFAISDLSFSIITQLRT
jgi:hypothetical protein